MTGMELADTAIKILGGAVVGGSFSWVLLRTTQRHELQKALFERRCVILEDIAQSVTAYFTAVTQFYIHKQEFEALKQRGGTVTPEIQEMVDTARQDYYNAGRALIRVRATSFLLPNRKISKLILSVMTAGATFSQASKAGDENRIGDANRVLEAAHQTLMAVLEGEFSQGYKTK